MSAPVLERPSTALGRTIQHTAYLSEFVARPGSSFDIDGSEILSVFSVDLSAL